MTQQRSTSKPTALISMNFAAIKKSLGQVVTSATATAKDLSAQVPFSCCTATHTGALNTLLPAITEAGVVGLRFPTGVLRSVLPAQVAGTKALRDYVLEVEVASGGLNGLWKIFSAHSRKEGMPQLAVQQWQCCLHC